MARVFITGSTDGLGRAAARALLDKGNGSSFTRGLRNVPRRSVMLSNAVDPGWVRTRMGGPGASVDLDTGQRTQSWLATSNEPAATVSGCYWHDLRQERPAREVTDILFQDGLIDQLRQLTGIALPVR